MYLEQRDLDLIEDLLHREFLEASKKLPVEGESNSYALQVLNTRRRVLKLRSDVIKATIHREEEV